MDSMDNYLRKALADAAQKADVALPEGCDNIRLFILAQNLRVSLWDLCGNLSSEAYYLHLNDHPPAPVSDLTFLEGEEPEPEEEP